MRNTKNLLEAMPLAMLPTKSLQHCQDQMILAIIFFYKFIAILYKLKVQFCNHTTFLLVIIFRQHLNFERISILKEPRQWQKKQIRRSHYFVHQEGKVLQRYRIVDVPCYITLQVVAKSQSFWKRNHEMSRSYTKNSCENPIVAEIR